MKAIALGVIAALAVGCATAPQSAVLSAADIYVDRDAYTGFTQVTGPSRSTDFMVWPQVEWRARAFRHATQAEWVYQVYVVARFSDWAFLDSAWAGGLPLNLTEIDREVGGCSRLGCSVLETVGVNLTAAQIETFSATGLEFKIVGQRDEIIVAVPAAYLQAILAAAAGVDVSDAPATSFTPSLAPHRAN